MWIKTGEGMRAVLWSSGLIVARNAEIWLKQSIQEHLQIGPGASRISKPVRFFKTNYKFYRLYLRRDTSWRNIIEETRDETLA